MKICRLCHQKKALEDFYKMPAMKDGRDSKCKECTKERVKKNYKENIDYYRLYEQKRNQLPHRKKARKDYWNKTKDNPEFKEKKKAYAQKYKEENELKRAAHVIWGNHVRKYKIEAEPCVKCGETDGLHAHHEDYNKPLDIIWLCRECHGKRHREINKAIIGGEDWSHKGFYA